MTAGHVVLGMSGGVDSSLSAALLLEQGYRVTGLVMAVPFAASPVEKAKRTAEALGIELIVKDVGEAFIGAVIDRFINEYFAGRTPNPCVFCNPAVKFEALRAAADEIGAEYIATGHYAEIKEKDGRSLLCRAEDLTKDQSYMLYRLPQAVLSRVLFPLAGLHKTQVRVAAAEKRLESASISDSQEICFVPDGDYAAFIQRYTGRDIPTGNYVDTAGKVLGRHCGIVNYTVGQRKGLNISLGRPAFVKGIDTVKNAVTLTTQESELFHTELTVRDVVFIPFDTLTKQRKVTAKVRYSNRETAAVITPLKDGRVHVEFETPVRAPAPGQSCVFYDRDIVVGGGYIE